MTRSGGPGIQRYALSPYLYTLAYRASLAGEPVAPPLVYYYQNDPNVRRQGGPHRFHDEACQPRRPRRVALLDTCQAG